jgi:quinol monooxygenase YgiN
MFAIALSAAVFLFSGAPVIQDDDPIVQLVKEKVPDPSRPFILIVKLKAKTGEGPAIEKAFAPAITATLKEKGCILYELSRDTSSADTLLLYERWATVPDLAAHLKTPHIAKLLAELTDLTDSAPDLEVHVPVGK